MYTHVHLYFLEFSVVASRNKYLGQIRRLTACYYFEMPAFYDITIFERRRLKFKLSSA